MKKIRINELARELEVKAHEILDRLPELGVTEKKTHSSSIDEDVAIKLRRLYGFDGPYPESSADHEDAGPEVEAHEPEPTAPVAETAVPVIETPPPAAPPKQAEPAAEAPVPEKPAAPTGPPVVAPVRPPLAGRPIHPPVGP